MWIINILTSNHSAFLFSSDLWPFREAPVFSCQLQFVTFSKWFPGDQSQYVTNKWFLCDSNWSDDDSFGFCSFSESFLWTETFLDVWLLRVSTCSWAAHLAAAPPVFSRVGGARAAGSQSADRLEDRVKPGNMEEKSGGSVGRHETLQVSFLFTAVWNIIWSRSH